MNPWQSVHKGPKRDSWTLSLQGWASNHLADRNPVTLNTLSKSHITDTHMGEGLGWACALDDDLSTSSQAPHCPRVRGGH